MANMTDVRTSFRGIGAVSSREDFLDALLDNGAPKI